MAQYIDKAVVEAEIDRVLNSYDQNEITSGRYALADLRDFINTLESKELYLDDTAKETPSNKTLFNKTDSTLEDAWNKLYVALHKVQELEKQGEHKDNIDAKPKFNVDDWVVGKYPDDGSYIHNVVGVKRLADGTYVYALDDNTYFSGSQESFYHVWSIKDAKPGDVLAANECLVLFREIDGLNIRCYCTYHFMYNPSFYVNTLQNKDAFHPATKEQCTMLEKAMADAGYAFDLDKKELKKIENEEYDGEDYGIGSLWHAKNILEKTLGEVDGYQTDDGILEHKCAIAAIDKLYKQKPAWSAEDTFKVQSICKHLDEVKKYYADITEVRECIDWLKSLDGRVLPQQKKEWSEEDESNFQRLIDVIKENKHRVTTDYEHQIYYKLLSWFKALKDRYVWKPSDEQIQALDWALGVAKYCGYACAFDLGTLQDKLKKLK